MRFDFVKCHGSGNDFALLDARGLALSNAEWARVAIALADRGGSVGSDGILLLGQGTENAAFSMNMLNSDGSEAETCLNGLRCVARAGFAAFGVERATVELKTSYAEVAREPALAPGVYTVRETAGPASLAIAAWPLGIAAERLVETPIAALGTRAFTAVAMPNPHLVAFVDDIDEDELVALGSACEAAPAWLPHRANVSFVKILDADAIFVRTFERGVGLTDSCGSAMAASTYAAALTGRVGFDGGSGGEVVVLNRGGRVLASARADGMVTLHGNATFEWAGAVEVDLARELAGEVTVARRFEDEIAAWGRVVDR